MFKQCVSGFVRFGGSQDPEAVVEIFWVAPRSGQSVALMKHTRKNSLALPIGGT